MPYVEVEFDLSDFNTPELCEEVCKRLKKVHIKNLDERQRKELKSALQGVIEELGLSPIIDHIKITTLEDSMKLEHLIKVWNKYTWIQIENLLP
jgi:hypothetical protein